MQTIATRRPRSLILASAVALTLTGLAALPAQASSHREAPSIAGMPKVDGTDFYMFNSYETGRSGFVTMIANYVPLQDSYGGPNYFAMDPKALYEIHLNNDGSGKENITFQFRFNTQNKDIPLPVSIPLVAAGQLCGGAATCPAGPSYTADAKLNVFENYSVTVVQGDRRAGSKTVLTSNGHNTLIKPFDNIGKKTIPSYTSYAAQYVYPLDDFTIGGATCHGGKVFVGQRADPFFVNLGQIFDLINVQNSGANAPFYTGGTGLLNAQGADNGTNFTGSSDIIADKNVTSLALELPASCLTKGTDPVIGGWTTASVRQSKIQNPTPSNGAGAETADTTREGGAWSQVSRLGMPLVNEVVIGLKDKDKFNASKPVNDVANFAPYVLTPSLPHLIDLVFGLTASPTGTVVAGLAPLGITTPVRDDLIAAFLTGVTFTVPANANLQVGATANVTTPVTFSNVPATGASTTLAEMLRLNTAIPATPVNAQRRLGLIGLDAAGFPNGRRLIDDVVDIELRVAEGRLCSLNGILTATNWQCTPTTAPAGLVDFSDGIAFKGAYAATANTAAVPTNGTATSPNNFGTAFPYVNDPIPGSP